MKLLLSVFALTGLFFPPQPGPMEAATIHARTQQSSSQIQPTPKSQMQTVLQASSNESKFRAVAIRWSRLTQYHLARVMHSAPLQASTPFCGKEVIKHWRVAAHSARYRILFGRLSSSICHQSTRIVASLWRHVRRLNRRRGNPPLLLFLFSLLGFPFPGSMFCHSFNRVFFRWPSIHAGTG
jgi:hypothetical protein